MIPKSGTRFSEKIMLHQEAGRNAMRRLLRVAALFAVVNAGAAHAEFPDHTVRILVTIPPGGAPDIAARLLAQKLTENLGQPFVVENRTGANGNLAGDQVAKATPDGYTLILGADSLIAINPHIYSKMTYDPIKDLLPVASVATNQFFLAVNPKLPVNTLPEFIEHARKAQPALSYASGGNGSQHQLGIQMLKQRAGIDLLHVPYRGGAPAGTATIAGETQVVLAGASNAPHLKSGQLRGLATTGAKRSPLFPDMPTIGEFYPGYELTIWLGLFAPVGTPEPIVTQLLTEVHKALTGELAERLNVTGALTPLIASPEEFSALIRRDYEKYGKLAREIGVKID
jgi:tripartite-type tricarboxylate transporter receptor subunit TctC